MMAEDGSWVFAVNGGGELVIVPLFSQAWAFRRARNGMLIAVDLGQA
jgi:hypothetical protein